MLLLSRAVKQHGCLFSSFGLPKGSSWKFSLGIISCTQGPVRPSLSCYKAPINYVGLVADITPEIYLSVKRYDLPMNSTFQNSVEPETRKMDKKNIKT